MVAFVVPDSVFFWVVLVFAVGCLLVASFMFRSASLAEDDLMDDVALASDTVAFVSFVRDIFRGWEYSIIGRYVFAAGVLASLGAVILFFAAQG
jgi:hypothetical protein